jgi:hypothetical protein
MAVSMSAMFPLMLLAVVMFDNGVVLLTVVQHLDQQH